MFKRKRFPLMDEAGDGAGAGGGAAAAGAGEGGESGSLFDGVKPGDGAGGGAAGEGAGAGAGGKDGGDDPLAWLPPKYRVNAEDGKLDEAASARKLGEAYKHLEGKLGNAAALPPATPEEYKLEPILGQDGKPVEGIDLEGFAADPLFKDFAKDAHAQGMTNAQLNFAVQRYLTIAPELVKSEQALSLQDAKVELGKLWSDEATMQTGLQTSVRAIQAFGGKADDMPGSAQRLMDRYGRDPDFIAFAAAVGREVGEDKLPGRTSSVGQPTEQEIAELQNSKAYWDASDPAHERVKAKVSEFYARKFGTGKS